MSATAALGLLLLGACATRPVERGAVPVADAHAGADRGAESPPAGDAAIDGRDATDRGRANDAAVVDESPAAPAPSAPHEPAWVELAPRVRVDRASRTVEFEALVVLDTGFLEQFVCTEGTREHESLFVFEGAASGVHAALLFAGFTAGAPGRWVERGQEQTNEHGTRDEREPELRFEGIGPTGSALEIEVRLPDGSIRPIGWFVRAAPIGGDREGDAADTARDARREPRAWRFVFGGSRFRRDSRTGEERYVADGSGSLVGLVTFGDETIGPAEVLPDQTTVLSPMWEVWTERMPPLGTRVAIIVRPAG